MKKRDTRRSKASYISDKPTLVARIHIREHLVKAHVEEYPLYFNNPDQKTIENAHKFFSTFPKANRGNIDHIEILRVNEDIKELLKVKELKDA